MRFDVAIGNPPYNNDIYIEFIHRTYDIADSVCMITPAKWWAKRDSENERFRDKFSRHISDITYYKDAKDIFDIGEPGGIAYYLITHDVYTKIRFKSECIRNKAFESDGIEERSADNLVLINDKLLRIISKINNRNTFGVSISELVGHSRQVYVGEQDRGEETIPTDSDRREWAEVMQGRSCCGYKRIDELFTVKNLFKYKCIQPCMTVQGSGDPFNKDDGLTLGSNIVSILSPGQVPKGSFQIMAYFDSYEEAKNFKSYINSKTMSLMQFLGVCGTQLTHSFFRYIPYENNWSIEYVDDCPIEINADEDGVYTDTDGKTKCSLYRKFRLSTDDIEIIDNVIKQRS